MADDRRRHGDYYPDGGVERRPEGYDTHILNSGIHVTPEQKARWEAGNTVVDPAEATVSGVSADALAVKLALAGKADKGDVGKYIVVTTLPDASTADPKAIYLVPKSSAQTRNVYDEYIRVEPTTGTYAWEKIGDTEIDLSGYASEAEAEALRQGKQDALTEQQLANIEAVPGKLDATSAAPAFSDSAARVYAVGNHCTYNGKLYTCVIQTTGGTWNASCWSRTELIKPPRLITPGNLASFTDDIALADSGIAVQNVVVKSNLITKLDSTSAAPAFSTTATYEVGDPVTYNGVIYKCTTAVTSPGAWNKNYWEATSVVQMLGTMTVIDDRLVPLDGPGSSTVSMFGNSYLNGHFSDWLSVGAGNMAYTARNATTRDWAYPTELFTDRFVFAVKAPITGGYGAFRRSLSFPFSGVYRVSIEYTPIKQGATPLQLPVVIGLSCNGGATVWNNVGQREYGRLHSAYALVSTKAGAGFIDVMARESGERNGFAFSRLKVELVDKAGVEVAEVDDELSSTSENPVQNKVVTAALNERPTKSALDTGWWSEWTILRDGVDVTAQITSPPEWNGTDWDVSSSHISSDSTLSGIIGGREDAESLEWVADDSEYQMTPYTATRHRVAAPVPTKPKDIGAASRASPATAGNLAALDANGNPVDSGRQGSQLGLFCKVDAGPDSDAVFTATPVGGTFTDTNLVDGARVYVRFAVIPSRTNVRLKIGSSGAVKPIYRRSYTTSHGTFHTAVGRRGWAEGQVVGLIYNAAFDCWHMLVVGNAYDYNYGTVQLSVPERIEADMAAASDSEEASRVVTAKALDKTLRYSFHTASQGGPFGYWKFTEVPSGVDQSDIDIYWDPDYEDWCIINYSTGDTDFIGRHDENDKSPISYNGYVANWVVTQEINGLADRAINTATLGSSVTTATVTLPVATAGYARNFYLDLTVQSTSAPTIIFHDPATSTIATIAFGADSLADVGPGANLVHFTELPGNRWLVDARH